MGKIILPYLVFLLMTHYVSCQSDDSDILGEEQIPITGNEETPINGLKYNQTQPSTQQQVTVKRQFNFDIKTLQRYQYEVGAVFAIIIYLILFRVGKARNYDLMESFYKKIKAYIYLNFSHIGFTKTSGQDPFVAQSPSEAMFYASGRQNVEYLEIKFNMLKRQDLLYHLIYQTIYPEKDLITIDIPVKYNIPVVFCLANKKKLKHITQTNIDIAKLAGTFQVKGVNSNYHILAQAAQVVDSILDGNTCKKLNDLTSLIYSIHFTDQKLFSQGQGHLRAIFYASEKNLQKYLPGLQLLFNIVDKLANLKISANYKSKAFKARESFNASIQKQRLQKHKQELRKKKQEKKKQEDAWLRSLPPQKQKRQQQKKRKKQMNKMLKSKVMKIG